MYLKLCLALMLAPTMCWSGSLECAEQAEKFGGPVGPSRFEDSCLLEAISNSPETSRSESKDGSIKVFGYKNYIVIQKSSPDPMIPLPQFEIIAGSSTRLQDIGSLVYKEKQKKIFVRDRSTNEKLVFNSEIPGNVGPKVQE